jgi:capsular polysaccharide biosynthesis protein
MMSEISIKDIFVLIVRKWWILLICMLLFGGTAYAYSIYYLVPVYQAQTTLYVGKNAAEESISTNDIYLGSYLINDYREIAKSRIVASAVISELGLNMDPNSLMERIKVSQKEDTRVVQLSINDTDPQIAMVLTNKVAEVFQKTVTDIMKIENVQILDKAELPTYPVSPNKSMNLQIGILIGFVIALGIIFLTAFLDDTIKTAEDVKEYVDLPVIGTIPVFPASKKVV